MCDSSSAICLAQNSVFHGRVEHLKVRHHIEKGDIEMKYIDTERQLADIFTKLLDVTCFASLLGGGTWCLPSLWHGLKGELLFYLVYNLSLFHRIAFHSYLLNITLLDLLDYLVTVLG
jgi:hypothetical protein